MFIDHDLVQKFGENVGEEALDAGLHNKLLEEWADSLFLDD